MNVELHGPPERVNMSISGFKQNIDALAKRYAILRTTLSGEGWIRMFLMNYKDAECVEKYFCGA
jgi:hypothetical protein